MVGTTGGVFIADVTNLVSNPSTTTDYEQISTHYLTLDDTIDLTTGKLSFRSLFYSKHHIINILSILIYFVIGEITFASWKSPLAGQETSNTATASKDIFSSNKNRQWADTAIGLFNNKRDDTVTSVSKETNPQFQVNLIVYFYIYLLGQ